MILKKNISLVFLSVLLTPGLAEAELSLVGKNRVVFESDRVGSRLRLDILNYEQRPALASISIEWGDDRKEEIPLAVSSPLVNIPPYQQKSIEVFYQGRGLPKDRESYFLLSILDVPTAPQQVNALQVALRHRYKLFVRPKLGMTPQEAADLLRWKQLSGQGGVEASNPSPYYLTITNLAPQDGQGHECNHSIPHMMLAPFSKKVLESVNCSKPIKELKYSIVTDSGREIERRARVKGETGK